MSEIQSDEVRELLGRLGWTHAKAAEELGVHRVTVSRWVTGATRIPNSKMKHLTLIARTRLGGNREPVV